MQNGPSGFNTEMKVVFGTEINGLNTENRGDLNIETFYYTNIQYLFWDFEKVISESRWS